MKLKNSRIFLLAFSLFLGSCAKEEMAPPYEQPVDEHQQLGQKRVAQQIGAIAFPTAFPVEGFQ